MINESLLRRYLKQLLLILLIIMSLLAFVWINFLYTRFHRDTQRIMAQQEETIIASVEERAQGVLEAGERTYQQEYEELKLEMQAMLNSVRSAIYSFYAGQADDALFLESVNELSDAIRQQSGYSFYLIDRNNQWSTGDIPPSLPPEDASGFVQIGSTLLYLDRLYLPSSTIYLYTDSESKVRENMERNLAKFLQMDPSVLVFDEEGVNLTEDSPFGSLEALTNDARIFYSVETSEQSGYTFGYAITRADLERMLTGRNTLFAGFLRNHIWELAGFFTVLVVTALLVFRQFFRALRRDQSQMKEILLSAYEGKTELSNDPYFKHFTLTPTLNSIFEDVRSRRKKGEEYIHELELQVKRQDVRLLSLERKVRSLSSGSFFTEGVLSMREMEEFSLVDLIRSVHESTDPQAELILSGEPFLLENDPVIIGDILRDFFSLSRGPERHYRVMLSRQEEQLQMYLSLRRPDAIDEHFFDHLKRRARALDGTLLKDNTTQEGLHMSLLIPLE